MKVRQAVLAGVGTVGLGLMLGLGAAPASAATAWACPDDSLCVWTGANGTGARAVFKNGDVNLATAPARAA